MANSNTKLRAYARYDGQDKIVPGSLILREEKPTSGNFKELGPIGSGPGPTPSSCDASHLNLETLLTNMNSCYTEVTSLFPSITYFTDDSSDDGITSISNGCSDMYDGGNLFNTNLTQTYNVARRDDVNFNDSIPYTHTQDENNNACDYYNPPMDGQIVSGTGIFNSASTTCSKYFTNMYPGMFMLAATGVNVAQFGIYGNLGTDGNGVVYANSDLTNYPDWTVYYKANQDFENDDPSVTHVILVYGDIDNVAQVVDCRGSYDDDVLVGLDSTNTAVITIVFATEAGQSVISIEDAVNIADKILDIYTNGCPPADPTLITIDTTDQGDNFEVSLPYQNGGGYNGTIDWGDGTITDNTYDDSLHTYVDAGVYTISINGLIIGFNHRDNSNTLLNVITSIDNFGSGFNFGPDNGGYFYECADLTTLASNIPLSGITDMSRMFMGASAFNQDINNWDVSNVTNMDYMFSNATSFDIDLNNWDVSNVTSMSNMFSGAAAFNENITGWNVSNVTTINGMFDGATVFNQDISGWDVGNVQSFNRMFAFANAFNQDIGGWNVSSASEMVQMFSFASSFNQNINSWNVSNVADMSYMFIYTPVFNQPLNSWDVSNVNNMDYMFQNAVAFNQDLSGWCVTLISNEPTDFATSATSWVLPQPVWGTCPGPTTTTTTTTTV